MKRRKKKASAALLVELRANFRLKVVFGGDPDGPALPCWFGDLPGIDSCEGRIEAAHFLKQQRMDNALFAHGVDAEMRELCRWDVRWAVPACEKHHRRFDGHRVDATNPLTIWREEVPGLVEAAARDWGLESELERRFPSHLKGAASVN